MGNGGVVPPWACRVGTRTRTRARMSRTRARMSRARVSRARVSRAKVNSGLG